MLMYLPARLQTVSRATRSLEFCETRPQTLPSCIAPSSPPDSSHRTSGMLLHHCGPNHKLNLLAYTSFNLLAACSWHACDICMFEIMLWRLPLAMSLASSVSIIACQSQQSTLTTSFDYAPPAVLCCAVLCCAVLCCAVLCSTPSLPAQLRPVSHSLLSRLKGQNLKHGQPLRPPGELRTGQRTVPLPQLQRLHPTFSLLCQAHLQHIGIQGSFISPICALPAVVLQPLCCAYWCC